MMANSTRVSLLIIYLCAIIFSTYSEDLELNLNRDLFIPCENDICGQLTCFAKGGELTIETVTLSKLKGAGESIQLFEISEDHPHSEIIFDNLQGSGSLKENLATIRVSLFNVSGCVRDDVYTCRVIYVTKSGRRETAFSLTGSEPDLTGPNKESDLCPATSYPGGSADLDISVLEYLGQKIARVEESFVALGDSLDKELKRQVETLHERVLNLETQFATNIMTKSEEAPLNFATESDPAGL